MSMKGRMTVRALASCVVAAATLALVLLSPGAAAAADCKAGETRYKNGIFWTCICTTSGGQTWCRWQAD